METSATVVCRLCETLMRNGVGCVKWQSMILWRYVYLAIEMCWCVFQILCSVWPSRGFARHVHDLVTRWSWHMVCAGAHT